MTSQLLGDSAQIKLINEWGRGFKEKNIDIFAKHLHKDFRRFIYPRSIGQPELNKDEWLAYFSRFINFATTYEYTLHSCIEAPGKIIVHATQGTMSSFGVNMVRESIFIIHIVTDDDGTLKIKQVEEFTDSKAYLEIVQALEAAKSNK